MSEIKPPRKRQDGAWPCRNVPCKRSFRHHGRGQGPGGHCVRCHESSKWRGQRHCCCTGEGTRLWPALRSSTPADPSQQWEGRHSASDAHDHRCPPRSLSKEQPAPPDANLSAGPESRQLWQEVERGLWSQHIAGGRGGEYPSMSSISRPNSRENTAVLFAFSPAIQICYHQRVIQS